MIFLDTGFIFALVYADDVNHARVAEVFNGYRGHNISELVLTTNHVVAETVTLLRKRAGRSPRARHTLAVEVGAEMIAGTFGQIHRTSEAEEAAALRYMADHHDKDYSFVDCLSFVVMERLGIGEALAVDADFTHRFVARPGPRPI